MATAQTAMIMKIGTSDHPSRDQNGKRRITIVATTAVLIDILMKTPKKELPYLFDTVIFYNKKRIL
jgi:hypothetical protein